MREIPLDPVQNKTKINTSYTLLTTDAMAKLNQYLKSKNIAKD